MKKYNPNLRILSECSEYSDGRFRIPRIPLKAGRGLRYSDAGFTLTEMLVVITIFVLIVVSVFFVQSLSHQTYLKGEMAAEINQNGRVILERMTREIRQAREIVTELPTTSTQATSTIEFEDGHITDRYHYIRYSQKNQNVFREEIKYYFPSSSEIYQSWNAVSPSESLSSSTTKSEIIGEYVTGLGFWDFPVINVSITLEKSDRKVYLQTKIFGRNL